jgi:23S rRNA (uracil1939-C5)-methyltransferase
MQTVSEGQIMIENFKASIEAANLNAKENNAKNCSGMVLDAKNITKVKINDPFYVITDPPRTGMDIKTILWLREAMPDKIIYISCNPEQLQKELPKLKGYKIKSASIFDLFPNTPHVESVVELVRE